MTGSTILKSIAAGAAGAAAVTLLHQLIRRAYPHAPRLDVLGMRGVARSFRAMDQTPPKHLYRTALAADIVSNTAYYGLVGALGSKKPVLTGSLLGLAAGIGSATLPSRLGLGSGPTERTAATQAIAAGLYGGGGLLAGLVYRMLRK